MCINFFAVAVYLQCGSFQGGKLRGKKCTFSRETILDYKERILCG